MGTSSTPQLFVFMLVFLFSSPPVCVLRRFSRRLSLLAWFGLLFLPRRLAHTHPQDGRRWGQCPRALVGPRRASLGESWPPSVVYKPAHTCVRAIHIEHTVCATWPCWGQGSQALVGPWRASLRERGLPAGGVDLHTRVCRLHTHTKCHT